jgi:thiopeptide-type bacteriocin biosynthesis protein
VDRAASDWRTVELYGDAIRQDRVLLGAVAPAITEARASGELAAWFFLRYVDALGRPHLRVRLRGKLDAAERRLRRHLAPAIAAGDVVDVRTAPYFREEARYGGAAPLDAWERLFEAESDATLRLLETFDPDADPIVSVVAALEATARTVGLDDEARHALARRLRDATGHGERADAAADYRRVMRALAAPGVIGAPAYPVPPPPPDALEAALHLTTNRAGAADPDVEARAYYLWERALDGLRARKRPKRT